MENELQGDPTNQVIERRDQMVDIQTGAAFPIFLIYFTGVDCYGVSNYQVSFLHTAGQALHTLFKEKYNRKPKVLAYETDYYHRDWNGKLFKVKSFGWYRSMSYPFGTSKFVVNLEELNSTLEVIQALTKIRKKNKKEK